MRRLRANALVLLTGSAGSAALAFVLSALIGRALGETGLGVYATALAWAFPLAIIADAGVGTLITRDLAADLSRSAAYLHAAVRARLLIGGGLASALFFAAPLLSDTPTVIDGIRLSAPLVVTLPFFGAFTALFRAQRVMWPVALLNVGMLAAQVTLTGIVFALGGDVLDALTVNVLTSTGQLLAAYVVYRRWFRVDRRRAPLHPDESDTDLAMMALLRRAWPFAVAAVLSAMHLRLNVILLERLTDTGTAGLYAAAGRFIEGANLVGRAYFDALFPALGAVIAQPDALASLFQRAQRTLLLLGLVFAGGGVLVGPLLVTLVYGATFTDAGIVLQLAGLSLLPGLLKGGFLLLAYATGRAYVANAVIGGTLALRVAGSALLIPAGGAVGAALVDVLVETAALTALLLSNLLRPDPRTFGQINE